MTQGLIRRAFHRLFGGGNVKASPNFTAADRIFFLNPLSDFIGSSGSTLKYPYKQHAWVYACVSAIATNIAGIPILWYSGDRANKNLVEKHDLISLFESPNPYMSGTQLIEATMVFLGLRGEACWVLERDNPRSLPREIWTFDPLRFKEIIDEKTGLIRAWEYRKAATAIPLDASEVIFFRYFNPYNDYRGLSPLEAAWAGVEQDWFAQKYNKSFYENDAQPCGILNLPGILPDEEFQRFKSQIEDRHVGAGKGRRIMFLEGGASYTQMGLTQKDMDFIEQRRWNLDEILAVYKVPKNIISLTEKFDSYAKARVNERQFWTQNLMPKMGLLEWVMWARLCQTIPGVNIWPEFDYGSIDALQEDYGEKVDAAHKLWSMGVPLRDVNEKFDLGLDTQNILGADTPYVPFNLVPAGEGQEPGNGDGNKTIELALSPIHSLPTLSPGAALPNPLRLAAPTFDGATYWEQFLKTHGPLEKKFHGKMRRYFFDQRVLQLKIIKDHLKPHEAGVMRRDVNVEDLLFSLAAENDRLKKIVWPLYVEIGTAAGEALYTEMGFGAELFNLQDTEAISVLRLKLLKVTKINDTTREALRQTLVEGMTEMESWESIARRVRDVYNMTSTRAWTIARTETGQAMGTARYAGLQSLGVERIRWVTAGDERVRGTHRALDGLTVKIGESFANGCRHPSDPSGPAGEIINCRCVAAPVVDTE